jgi:hypothetical protein
MIVTAQKTARNLRTQQRKQITKNANLSLIQDWKHKDAKQEHDTLKDNSNRTLF